MRKILFLLLSLGLVCMLAACGGNATPSVTEPPAVTDPSAEQVTLNGIPLHLYAVVAETGCEEEAKLLADTLKARYGLAALAETSANGIYVGTTMDPVDDALEIQIRNRNVYLGGSGADGTEGAVLLFLEQLAACEGTALTVEETSLALSEIPTETVYVAVNGNDTNAGTQEAPKATLVGALQAIEAMDGKALFAKEIVFAAGTYHFDESVKLTEENGGRSYAPLTIRAEAGSEVVFTGGFHLKAEEASKVTDASILDRLATPAARDHIYSISLAPYFASFADNDTAGNQSMISYLPILFYADGAMQTQARYPNDKSMEVVGVETDMEGDGVPFYYIYLPEEYGKHANTYWSNATYANLYANGYFDSDAYDEGLSVRTMGVENNAARADYIGMTYLVVYNPYNAIHAGQSFYFRNALEELDMAGEYYIDPTARVLYFYCDGALPDTMYVSGLETDLLQLQKASYVTVDGIDFAYTRGSGIALQNASHVTVRDCDFRGISATAISLLSAEDVTVSSCSFAENGRGAITAKRCGSVSAKRDGAILIQDCTVTTSNLVKVTGSPCISLTGCYGVTVRGCTLENSNQETVVHASSDQIVVE